MIIIEWNDGTEEYDVIVAKTGEVIAHGLDYQALFTEFVGAR